MPNGTVDTFTPFGFSGGNGCQTDVDLGLVLMGHRYYDPRVGRFLSQDPAGDGDNWYAYADNSPTNEIDPMGLSDGAPGSVGAPDQHYGVFEGGGDDTGNGSASWNSFPLYLTTSQRTRTGTYVWDPDPIDGNADHMKLDLVWGAWGPWTVTDSQPLGAMFAGETSLDGNPQAIQLTKELVEADDGTAGTLERGWGKGSYNNAKECAEDHFKRKGKDVNAKDYLQYLRKAEAYGQNLKRATTQALDNGG